MSGSSPPLYIHTVDRAAPLGSFLNPYPPPAAPTNATALTAPNSIALDDSDIEAFSLSDSDDDKPLHRQGWDRRYTRRKPSRSEPWIHGAPIEDSDVHCETKLRSRRVSFHENVWVHKEQTLKERKNGPAGSGRELRKIPGAWVSDGNEISTDVPKSIWVQTRESGRSGDFQRKGRHSQNWGMLGADDSLVGLHLLHQTYS